MIELFMPSRMIRGRILKWGNSFGIRLSKKELAASGARPGQDVSVTFDTKPRRIDLSHWPTFDSGRSDVSKKHDEYFAADLAAEQEERNRAARRRH